MFESGPHERFRSVVLGPRSDILAVRNFMQNSMGGLVSTRNTSLSIEQLKAKTKRENQAGSTLGFILQVLLSIQQH